MNFPETPDMCHEPCFHSCIKTDIKWITIISISYPEKAAHHARQVCRVINADISAPQCQGRTVRHHLLLWRLNSDNLPLAFNQLHVKYSFSNKIIKKLYCFSNEALLLMDLMTLLRLHTFHGASSVTSVCKTNGMLYSVQKCNDFQPNDFC